MVYAISVVTAIVSAVRLIGIYFRKVRNFHQAVHSADVDINTILMLENELYFIDTKTLDIIREDMKDKVFNALIFKYTRSITAVENYELS